VDTYWAAGAFRESDSVLAESLETSGPDIRARALDHGWMYGDVERFSQSADSALNASPNPSRPARALGYRSRLTTLSGRIREAQQYEDRAYQADSILGRLVSRSIHLAKRITALADAGLPTQPEVRTLDSTLDVAPLSRYADVDQPDLDFATAYAATGRADRARAVMAQYRHKVNDTALLRSQSAAFHNTLMRIARTEKRWDVAAAEMRKSDSLPDGPVDRCTYCRPIGLFGLFADAGMPDSALEREGRIGEGRRKLSPAHRVMEKRGGVVAATCGGSASARQEAHESPGGSAVKAGNDLRSP
jgi:hypothetical protein